jgi:hypothetical protein
MKLITNWWLATIALSVLPLFLVGCDDNNNSNSSTGTDSGSDSDTATVSDSAMVTDSATGTDTAIDTDTATGTDTSTSADTGTVADSATGTDTATDTDTATGTDTNAAGLHIALLGDAEDTVNYYGNYASKDPGATATDEVDGDLTASIVVDYSHINPKLLGQYTVTYSVTNSAGDTAQVTRTVDVVAPIIEVTDDITEDTTWTYPGVYKIIAWDMYVTATLVIEPGVIVMFTSDDGPTMQLSGSGLLLAVGTGEMPITFTSWRDDGVIGDVNDDGAVTTPLPGDWEGVDLGGSQNGSRVEYARFHYASGGSYLHALYHYGEGMVTVNHCIFSHNGGGPSGDSWYGALSLEDSSATSVVTNNVFYDNTLPMLINSELSLDDSNTFHNPDDASIVNTYQGIFVEAINEITGHITWAETEVAFVIDDNDMWIDEAASLTLADDVVLKFAMDSTLILAAGSSAISNYDGAGVYFTSFKDDSLKGDSNGDGTTGVPADGDWNEIYDNTAPVSADVDWFTWPNIRYDSH